LTIYLLFNFFRTDKGKNKVNCTTILKPVESDLLRYCPNKKYFHSLSLSLMKFSCSINPFLHIVFLDPFGLPSRLFDSDRTYWVLHGVCLFQFIIVHFCFSYVYVIDYKLTTLSLLVHV